MKNFRDVEYTYKANSTCEHNLKNDDVPVILPGCHSDYKMNSFLELCHLA